jgi:hypothetical protein
MRSFRPPLILDDLAIFTPSHQYPLAQIPATVSLTSMMPRPFHGVLCRAAPIRGSPQPKCVLCGAPGGYGWEGRSLPVPEAVLVSHSSRTPIAGSTSSAGISSNEFLISVTGNRCGFGRRPTRARNCHRGRGLLGCVCSIGPRTTGLTAHDIESAATWADRCRNSDRTPPGSANPSGTASTSILPTRATILTNG